MVEANHSIDQYNMQASRFIVVVFAGSCGEWGLDNSGLGAWGNT